MGGQSFSKELRISKTSDYKKVIQRGKRISTKNLHIYYLPNQLKFNRLAISLSRSIKGAVVRNKQKRAIREAFRTSNFTRKRYFDIIVRLQNGCKEIKFQDIREQLEKALTQAK